MWFVSSKTFDTDLTGRNVLIVEDIIDSGLTLAWLQQNLMSRGAASVEICALLRKPKAVKTDVEVKYVGWDIDPNSWLVTGLISLRSTATWTAWRPCTRTYTPKTRLCAACAQELLVPAHPS